MGNSEQGETGEIEPREAEELDNGLLYLTVATLQLVEAKDDLEAMSLLWIDVRDVLHEIILLVKVRAKECPYHLAIDLRHIGDIFSLRKV